MEHHTDRQADRQRQDTTIIKVDSAHSPRGAHGERYLASGTSLSMRLYENEQPGERKPPRSRDYETVGFVIKGRAELEIEGQRVMLEPGNSYVIPKGAEHSYRIVEPFTTVEATHPPYQVHGRDD